MNRNQPLRRSAPLRNRAPLRRNVSLSRAQPPQQHTTPPKTVRAPQTAEERTGRTIVKTRSGGWCEGGDGRCLAVHWHHRQNRSAGGQWLASNGMHLCAAHHQWATEHPTAAMYRGWTVPSWADPRTTPVWLPRRGWIRLDDVGGHLPADRRAA